MGINQHLIRSVAAIRAPGRRAAVGRLARAARPGAGRPQRRQGGGARRGARRLALEHRPRRRDRQPRQPDLLRRGDHADAPGPAGEGDRRRQAHLLREADRHQPEGGAGDLPPGQGQGHQERRGAGQAVPARPAEDEDAARLRLLRAHAARCAASSATGCSRATGRRRSGRRGTTAPRTAAASSSTWSATGATCSTTCSRRCARSPASAQRISPSGSTRPASATRRPPTMRPTPPSSSTAA